MAIYPASHHPTPAFGYKNERESRSHILIGTELEFDGPSHLTQRVSPTELSDRFDEISGGRTYCKSDGSLSYGVELVSHPGTLEHHMYVMHWQQLCRTAVKNGYRSHDTNTAGLHLHVGREQLGATETERDEVIRKVQIFFGRFKAELLRFSRRTLSDFEQWADCQSIARRTRGYTGAQLREYALDHYVQHRNVTHYHSTRYVAVNVNNAATVEIRIFKGTAKRDTLIASIQLVHNIFTWCMAHSWDDLAAATFADVALWRPYAEIVHYCEHRGLIELGSVETLPSGRRDPEFTGIDGTEAERA